MDLPRPGLAVPARSSRELRAILGAVRDGLCLTDGAGRITEVNEHLCAMTGFTAEELVGRTPPYAFWPEEAEARVSAGFRQALGGGGRTAQHVFRRKDGERFDVTVTSAPLDEDDLSAGLVGVMREVTHEVRERERLREAHRVARLVSMEYDLATGLVELSRDLSEIEGLDLPDRVTLDELIALVPAADRGSLRELIDAVVAGARPEATCEIALPIPDLEWVEVRMLAVRDGRGFIAGVRGTAQDVTARKRAELARAESEERLREAQRVARLGSFEIDYRAGTVQWSPGLFRLFGVDPGTEVLTLDEARALMPVDELEAVRRAARATLDDGREREFVHTYRRRGEVRYAEMRLEAIGDGPERHRVRGIVQDITDRERAAREIHLRGHLLDSVHVAVVAYGLDGLVTHWNHGAELLTGRGADEAIGRPALEISVAPEDMEEAEEIVARVIAEGHWEGEFRFVRKDGTAFPGFVRDALFHDLDGRPAGIVAVVVDITERVEVERQLRAAHDYQRAITDNIGEGLCVVDDQGRLLYLNRAGEELLGWRQEDLLGQVMHDVTHFRRPDGTPLPREECELQNARARGVVTRLDDEMFVRRDGTDLPVKITTAPFETAAGARGSVVVFSDITARKAREQALQERMELMTWVGRVYDALAEDRFVLYAQPIVDVATGETVQHELLLRMIGEDGEVVMPGSFLPAAEEHGVITDVDRWVMRQAVALAARGHAVELNLSALSVADPALVDDFARELRRAGADPSLIVIELTETALLRDEHAALTFIERARALGCKLALDDFGTGYGGFSYLKRLPFDSLKIDREFVRDLVDNAASRQVVEAVLGLARGFGQGTVAEGVEDEETLAVLREMGVDRAQGYLLARPAPVEDVLGR
jgi:PAS domain S-box-containing protein